jgi:hypothetical protein
MNDPAIIEQRDLETIVGESSQAIEIGGKAYTLHPLTMREMKEYAPLLREVQRINDLEEDYAARVNGWKKLLEENQARASRGEPPLAAGDRPERPAELAGDLQLTRNIESILRTLWLLVRKSGLNDEQIKRKQWAITQDEMEDLIEFNRVDEINDVFRRFLGRKTTSNVESGNVTQT